MNRRDFLSAALLAPAAIALQQDARFIGTVPFGVPGDPAASLDRLLGDGLDARQFSDLSSLSSSGPGGPVTATDRFFIRTAASPRLPAARGWPIALGGLVQEAGTIDVPALERMSQAAGRYLIECAGNADPSNFGLMSVADWQGTPVLALLDRVRPTVASHRVLISGFDDDAVPPKTSVPGASWIFSRDDLREAVLATRMNGAPLSRDHGAPVRLVVPGWYGCACIKWVNRIDVVADDAPATSQMWEFANRTHQPFDSLRSPEPSTASTGDSRDIVGSLRTGPPVLARDFTPAVIDTAAVPVRVEKWIVDGKVSYRVVGIIWGGSKPTNALAIRFKASQPWAPVENCPLPTSARTWSVWTHTWRPAEPGRYDIVLKVTDRSIRTRRLDLFYYVREIDVNQV